VKPNPSSPVTAEPSRVPSSFAGRPWIPKELTWLSFNERVLQEAEDERNPLLERLRFLGIFSNNLDEFYRVRVAGLQRLSRNKTLDDSGLGMPVRRLLRELKARVRVLVERFDGVARTVFDALDANGIHLVDEQHLDAAQARCVRDFFQTEVRPRLVPILCDRDRALPALRDHSFHLAVEVAIEGKKSPRYAIIEVPTDSLPRFFVLPRRGREDYVILLEDVIRSGLGEIFSLFGPAECRAWSLKITRDAELDIEEDTGETYVDRVQRGLLKRRVGAPVRMVHDQGLPEPFLRFILSKLKLARDDVIAGQRYHSFKDFMGFPTLGRPDLVRSPKSPLQHPALVGRRSVLETIADGDVLFHYPYHSFGSFIDFLREAAIDPHVTQIGLTVYRVAPTSSVLNALINAVRNGKRVFVVIELLARFDEENNLEWVDRLREEGVEVTTGVRGLKVHSKLCLVTRRLRKRTVHYAVIGTGNFNEETARLYTDHSLMTCDPRLTVEVLGVFEFFRANYKVPTFEHLIVSPFQARRHWRRLIRDEARRARRGEPAFVWIKLNNLSDPKLIDELCAAGRAGVEVRLIVRSMQALAPGVPGASERVEAVSLVGRYLEHSRILIFGNGGEPRVYVTSGDWMPRNFEDRVEVACPIFDRDCAEQLLRYFRLQWADTANARVWDPELSNRRREPPLGEAPQNCHDTIRDFLEGIARRPR
jgi:polyphosphate kinase